MGFFLIISGFSSPKSFDRLPQSDVLKGSDDVKTQGNQNFGTFSSFDTTATGNKGIQQGMFLQGSSNWQPSQTTEQRKTLGISSPSNICNSKFISLDSIPTSYTGSWQARS